MRLSRRHTCYAPLVAPSFDNKETGMSGTSETAETYIKCLSTAAPLSTEIKAQLAEIFGSDNLEALAGSIPGSVIHRIAAAMPGRDTEWLPIACAMIKGLQDMGYGKASQPAAAPATPQRVVVEMPKRLDERTTRELLDMLTNDEGDATEVI